MIKFLNVFVALFFMAASSCGKDQTSELATLNEIALIMEKHYYDTSYNGLDWKNLLQETREKIKSTANSRQRYEYISTLLKALNHSHLEFMPPFSAKKKGPQIPTGPPREINFALEKIDQKWLVTRVTPDSDAQKAGLTMGMAVKKVNKWPTADLFKDDQAMAFYKMRRTLQSFPREKISLTIESPPQIISWKLSPYKGTYERLGHVTDAAEFEQKTLPGNIGYIRFSIFLINPVKKAITAIKQFRDKGCRGIIIDIRNNPGGVAMMAPAIAKEFCRETYNLGTQRGRDMTLTFPVLKQPKPYMGTVVLLINKNSASTAEILAAGVQEKKQGYVIGEVSAGMALPSVLVTLKDGSLFQYPVGDFKTPGGQSIEGKGVLPDLKISHSQRSLLESKDVFIDTAIHYINSQN